MTKKSESLVLQNSDFAQNHVVYYRELMEYQEMTDITLACDDDSSIEAHKFILSASSPFFRNIIRNSRHQSPYVYLKGVKMDDLQALVTFMYTGETKVKAHEIKRFLTTAHELKVAGLIKNKDEAKEKDGGKKKGPLTEDTLTEDMDPEESQEVESMIENMENETAVEADADFSDLDLEVLEASDPQENEDTFADESQMDGPKDETEVKPKDETEVKKEKTKKERKRKEKIVLDPEVLKKEMDSRLKYVFDRALQKPVYVCIECNINFPLKRTAREHVETHLSGNGLVCTSCGVTFKGLKSLADHSKTCNLKNTE